MQQSKLVCFYHIILVFSLLFQTTKAFLPAMLEKNHGHVVSIASAAGLAGVNGLCDYCASKFGAVGFQESLHMEMQALKININTTVVCPFYINTGMFTGVKTRYILHFLLPLIKFLAISHSFKKALLSLSLSFK